MRLTGRPKITYQDWLYPANEVAVRRRPGVT